MVPVCRHALWSVRNFNAGTRRRPDCGYDRAAKSARQRPGLDVCTWLVLHSATTVALSNAGGDEREPRANGASGLGTDVHQLLEVLGSVDAVGGGRIMGPGEGVFAAMAGA